MLSFEKSFARKPAYWLEIYRVPVRNATAYIFTRQWNFVRDGENIIGQAPGRREFSLMRACEELLKIAKQKLEENWVLAGPAVVDKEAATSEQHGVNNALTQLGTWINNNELGVNSKAQGVNIVAEPIDPKNRQERFEVAEKKRRAKAKW
jgi:hypothetical protein